MWFVDVGVLKAEVCIKERECWHRVRLCASPTSIFLAGYTRAMTAAEARATIRLPSKPSGHHAQLPKAKD